MGVIGHWGGIMETTTVMHCADMTFTHTHTFLYIHTHTYKLYSQKFIQYKLDLTKNWVSKSAIVSSNGISVASCVRIATCHACIQLKESPFLYIYPKCPCISHADVRIQFLKDKC